MLLNTSLRFTRCFVLSLRGLLCVFGAASAVYAGVAPAASFDEVFCGAPVGPIHRTVYRPPVKGPTIVDVSIVNSTFDPPDVTINVGDTVRWTNNDGRTHTSTSDSSVWDSGALTTGQTFSFTFTGEGEFPFHCNFHPTTMLGTVTVQSGGPSVSISGFAFNPADLTINVGDTVTWTNNDGTGHTTTSDTGVWGSGTLSMGQTFSFQFNTPGVFPYHCAIHPFMTATITVNGPSPSPTNTPTSTPTNTPSATATSTPSPTPTAGGTPSISGVVSYPNAAVPPKFIAGANVCAMGSATVCTMTNSLGQYTLTGFGSGTVTVTASKTNQINGIASADAARVAQHVAGISVFTTNVQRISADVSNNGALSSTDAAKIAQYVAGITPLPVPNVSATWRFFVPGVTFPIGSSPQAYSLSPPTGPVTNIDFWGVLGGEVTGNWNPAGPRPALGPERSSIDVELPNITSEPGKDVTIPVHVQGAADKNVISYEFDLRYDPSVIQPTADPIDVKKTASRGLSFVTNPKEPGLLRIVVYGAMPIDSSELLLNLRFTAVGSSGAATPLSFESLVFNEGEPAVDLVNGQVTLF